jgi:hypothetical protein
MIDRVNLAGSMAMLNVKEKVDAGMGFASHTAEMDRFVPQRET